MTLSHVGCVVAEKVNPATKEKRLNKRIIVDAKAAKLTELTANAYKTMNPRVMDLVFGCAEMLDDLDATEQLDLLVIDIIDVFWHLPLHKGERCRFVTKYKGRFYVSLRAAQGSRGGPLTWSGLAPLVSRLIQGLFMGLVPTGSKQSGRSHIYVDGPIYAIRGTQSERKLLRIVTILAWRTFGPPLLPIKLSGAQLLVGFALPFASANARSKSASWKSECWSFSTSPKVSGPPNMCARRNSALTLVRRLLLQRS